MGNSKYVSGVAGFFADEHRLLDAAKATYKAGYRKFDSITPFPVHGMDDAIGLKPSWLPWITLAMGLLGTTCGFMLPYYMMGLDWPMIIGGKPYAGYPAYVPIMFELTILIGALSTVGGLFWVCGLPHVDPPIIDPDLTSHKFALFVPENDTGYEAAKVETFFKTIGAVEVRRVAEF